MKKSSIINDAKKVISTELIGIKKLNRVINANFEKAVLALEKIKGRVIITGTGKSGHIGAKVSSTLSSTGTPSQFILASEMSHGDLGAVSKKDALIIFSHSGNSNELTNLINYAKMNSILTIGISSNTDSELIKFCTISIIIPTAAEACSIGLAPTTSTTMALIIGDALAVSLMKKKSFKMSDFKRYHPGGALGAQMLQVKEVMHTGKKMPIVSEDANMKKVLIEMTKKSFGHVGVQNAKKELKGLVSDGDIRRIINKDFFDMKAKQIMTSRPKLIDGDETVINALNTMNKNKITCLFVVKNLKSKVPVGIIHIHDCIRYAN